MCVPVNLRRLPQLADVKSITEPFTQTPNPATHLESTLFVLVTEGQTRICETSAHRKYCVKSALMNGLNWNDCFVLSANYDRCTVATLLGLLILEEACNKLSSMQGMQKPLHDCQT